MRDLLVHLLLDDRILAILALSDVPIYSVVPLKIELM